MSYESTKAEIERRALELKDEPFEKTMADITRLSQEFNVLLAERYAELSLEQKLKYASNILHEVLPVLIQVVALLK